MKFRFHFTFQTRKWISPRMKGGWWEDWEECRHCKVKHSPWFLCSCHHSISIFTSKVWAWFLLWLSTTKNVELITKNHQVILIGGWQTIHFGLRNYSRIWQRNQGNSLVSTILLQEDILRWEIDWEVPDNTATFARWTQQVSPRTLTKSGLDHLNQRYRQGMREDLG